MSQTTAEPTSSEPASPKGYGTFEGVFVPTVVTILGVVMFLREGWVIGNAGFGGGVLIILLAFTITGTTALSLSSVTTNIRYRRPAICSVYRHRGNEVHPRKGPY